jgi:hypothetical protein
VKKRNVGGRTEPIGTDLSRLARPVEKGDGAGAGTIGGASCGSEAASGRPDTVEKRSKKKHDTNFPVRRSLDIPHLHHQAAIRGHLPPSQPSPPRLRLRQGPRASRALRCLTRGYPHWENRPAGWRRVLATHWPSHVMPLRQVLVELRKFGEELVCKRLHP